MEREKEEYKKNLLDPELEAIWREGIDDRQFDSISTFIDSKTDVRIPGDLKASLLDIPRAASKRDDVKSPSWSIFSSRYVTVSLALGVLILAGYHFRYQRVSLSGRSSVQAAAQADLFLQWLVEDESLEDIFDKDLSELEHLS